MLLVKEDDEDEDTLLSRLWAISTKLESQTQRYKIHALKILSRFNKFESQTQDSCFRNLTNRQVLCHRMMVMVATQC